MTPPLALADTLSVMLPSPTQTAFLGSCLAQGDALQSSWPTWQAAVEDPLGWLTGEGRALRGHLPRLQANLTANRADIPAALQPYLKAAVVRERRRWTSWVRGAEETMTFLAAAGVDGTLLAGGAVPALVAEAPHLRHCHDLDLWIPEPEVTTAVAALKGAGYAGSPGGGPATTRVDHPAGLPVMLHTELLPDAGYRLPVADLRNRRVEIGLSGATVQSLSRPDLFVHVCALASTPARRPHANWVVDAHRLASSLSRSDWSTVEDVVDRAGLALPLVVLFGYLREEVAGPLPAGILDELDGSARRATRGQQASALAGARHGVPGGLRRMVRRSGPRSRVTLAQTLLTT